MRVTAIIISSLIVCALLLSAAADPRRDGPIPCVLENLQLLDRSTNDARLGALEMLLESRSIPYQLEPIANPRPGARRAAGANVIVTIGSGSRDLLLSAHFDAAAGHSGLTAGALDNGAGVIALVHLADRLRTARMRHRVRIVFFDMEETGLIGSRHHVAGLEPGRVAAAVNVDVVGIGDTILLGPSRRTGNERLYEVAARTCAQDRQPCIEFPNYAPSDHLAFADSGIPHLAVGLMPRLEAHQFWLRLNGGDNAGLVSGLMPRTWAMLHTHSDRPEAVDPAAVTRAYEFLLGFVFQLDRDLAGA